MARESFTFPETQSLFRKLEELSQRSGVSRAVAFEDFLTAATCALAAETKEDEYLAMIKRHKSGRRGKRGADLMPEMFAELVSTMSRHDGDVLGDLFESAVSYQESAQYFTPGPVSQLVSELTLGTDEKRDDGTDLIVSDPACGTGRMLLDAARRNPNVEVHGVDIDARCANISAVNLGLRHCYGWIVCGNSLTLETRFAYRIAPFYHESPNGLRRGVIRDVPPELALGLSAASETAHAARDLFASAATAEEDAGETEASMDALPAIIEIPRWVLRLEQHTAGGREDEPQSNETGVVGEHHDDDPPPAGPMTQGILF